MKRARFLFSCVFILAILASSFKSTLLIFVTGFNPFFTILGSIPLLFCLLMVLGINHKMGEFPRRFASVIGGLYASFGAVMCALCFIMFCLGVDADGLIRLTLILLSGGSYDGDVTFAKVVLIGGASVFLGAGTAFFAAQEN